MTRVISAEKLFRGRHFDQEFVASCIRWYLSDETDIKVKGKWIYL